MVKFVGGPSDNSYKAYRNHTTAREGQFRIPRPTRSFKQEIKITNYHQCDGGAPIGYQPPTWMVAAKMCLDFANQFIPQPTENTAPDTNPFASELEDLQSQLEDLRAENERLKAQQTDAPPPAVEPDDNPDDVDTDTSEISITPITTEDTEATEGDLLTTPAVVRKGKRLSDNRVEYQGWQTLANAYGVPNTRDFRNWFRKEYLDGKDTWNVGTTQNFPTKITYKGQEYTFKAETFATAADYHTPSSGGGEVSTNNMGERRGPGKPAQKGSTTYSGTVTATVGGKTYTARVNGQASEDAARTALMNSLTGQGLTSDQASSAIRNARVKGNES